MAVLASVAGWAVAIDSTSSAALPASCSPQTRVHTAKGPVCGSTLHGVTTYDGIPYAAPPVGERRWRSPAPHKAWRATLAATREKPRCPSPGAQAGVPRSGKTAEDCLYLRVEKPADAGPGDNLPVIYEIHPGGFLGEARSDNGENLVRDGNVVYVYVNYRLGILGFLAHAALGAHSGDYGIQDQQAGMRWVRRNIAGFGGDPHNVTITGASAGGASVCDQLASPTAKGLFDKAISSSGFYNNPKNTIWTAADCKSTYATEKQAQRVGAKYAAKLGCEHANAAACLRKVPVQQLVAAGAQHYAPRAGGTVGPIVNGTTLTMEPARAFKTGHINHVPVMIGVGRDEFNGGAYRNVARGLTVVADSPRQLRELVRFQFGDFAPGVLRRYPLRDYASPYVAYRTIMADATAVCPLLQAAGNLSRHTTVFADINAYTDIPGVDPDLPLGALHDGVNRIVHAPPTSLDAGQRAMQSVFVGEWTHFAGTGEPAAAHTPHWPQFDGDRPQLMMYRPAGDSAPVAAHAVADRHHCAFWGRAVSY